MAASLNGRTAIVTGAGREVGEAISRELVSRGVRVAVVDFEPGAAERVTRALNEARPGSAVALAADVSVPAQAKRMTDTAWSALGAVDTLVNCVAVTGHPARVPDPDGHGDRLGCTSLTSAFLTTKYVARRMARSGTPGVIIHVDPAPGSFARPGPRAHPVAKSGIYTLTRSLALQFGEHGIRVDMLSLDKAGSPARHTEEPASRMRESLAGRASTPRDVASAVALMIADQTVLAAAGLLAASGARTALRRGQPG